MLLEWLRPGVVGSGARAGAGSTAAGHVAGPVGGEASADEAVVAVEAAGTEAGFAQAAKRMRVGRVCGLVVTGLKRDDAEGASDAGPGGLLGRCRRSCVGRGRSC